MQVSSSRKGTYLAVMGSVALVFVVFLYVAPSFWSEDHAPPPMEFLGVLAGLAVIATALWIWRQKLKHRTRLDRREGVVSGQVEHIHINHSQSGKRL